MNTNPDQRQPSIASSGWPETTVGAVIATEENTPTGPILHRAIWKCHRAPKDRPSTLPPEKQIRSKKDAHCPFALRVTVYKSQPDVAVIEELNGHVGHTPGSEEDLQWLRPENTTGKRKRGQQTENK